MEVKIIVAFDKNRLIGDGNKIPWYIPEDMIHFKRTTIHHPVIMGRNTWNSIPVKFRPLPERWTIVLTRDNSSQINEECKSQTGPYDTKVCSSLEKALELGRLYRSTVFIAGGAQIYKYALEQNLVDSILVSKVKGVYSGDMYFPELNPQLWKEDKIKEYAEFDIVEYVKMS